MTMPRKTAADLNDPIAAAWRRFEEQEAKLAELDAIADKMMNDKTGDGLKKGVSMDEFDAALTACTRQCIKMFGALDAWRHLVAHKDDPSTQPLVPTAEVASIIGMSLSDKMEGMSFSVNYGLLASKLATTISMDVEEGSAGDIPLCSDDS